ncbi:MAG: serine/threonine protein phosphatase [Bacteroidetes bacterium]|nr:serine/threonine protein phosphatase [Bacteroidota bacterium]
MRQIAISDIHGCSVTFLALLDRLALGTTDQLFLLGDYVDRGPDSKGVIDTIFKLQERGYQVQCLCGNHEELVLQAAKGDFTGLDRWLLTDGKDTMDSFGVKTIAEIPEKYLAWMQTLPYVIETNDYILVHAGLDFSMPDPLLPSNRMCWIRHWYGDIQYDWLGQRTIVHGHTPVQVQTTKIQLQHLDNQQYLDIDTGCVFSHERFVDKAGLGYLCAFDMSNRQVIFQENLDW